MRYAILFDDNMQTQFYDDFAEAQNFYDSLEHAIFYEKKPDGDYYLAIKRK